MKSPLEGRYHSDEIVHFLVKSPSQLHLPHHFASHIWEVHMLAPVGRRHAPAIGFPGVGDLLVPAVVKDTASPVVVAQDAQPDLSRN